MPYEKAGKSAPPSWFQHRTLLIGGLSIGRYAGVVCLLVSLLVSLGASSLFGQTSDHVIPSAGLTDGQDSPAFAEAGWAGTSLTQPSPGDAPLAPCCNQCATGCRTGGYVFGGAEFLLVRPHFSEAVAFARGMQTPSSFSTRAEELQFGYDGSMRAHAGYQFCDGKGGVRFTYSYLQGETAVNGSVAGPGEFIVDPFGNIVGTIAIIDPADPRFGTLVTGGDEIRTRASVETNVYDLDFTRELCARSRCWEAELSFGVRIADIDQFYDSVVTTANGGVVGQGEFIASFIGAGPRLGVRGRRFVDCNRRISLFASCHGAILLGDYDVRGDTSPVPGFQTSQSESLTRSVPVMETELGASWRFGDSLEVSLGWLFQAWFDMGTSGGTFGGFFAGADDANIMSFDGMFLRADFSY